MLRTHHPSLRLAALLLAVPASAGLAQQPAQQPTRTVTAADYQKAERFLAARTASLVSGVAIAPSWLPDGRLSYRVRPATGAPAVIVVDPRTGAKVNCATDAARCAGVPGVGAPTPTPTPMPQGGRRGSAPESRSPDGKKAAFIRDYNVWVRDVASGTETQLTTDGTKEFGYATDNAGWTHSDRAILTWSPDSKKIATFQHDGRGVRDMHLVSTNVGAPRLESWKYPLPGDSVIFRISRVVLNVEGEPKMVRLQMAPDPHRSTVSDHVACSGGTICDLQWFPDGSQLAFVSSARDHKTATFRVADARTGAVRTLFEERSQTQVGDASLDEELWRVLPATNELLWWSQRDNWVHLYLYDLATGKLKNRVTTGDGNVATIVRVDEKARVVYFMGQGKEAGRDPYFQHLYRIGFDGRNQRLLTPEDANHVVSMSPDGAHFVDTYSTPTTPPVTVLRDATGKLVQTLEKADVSRLAAAGWKAPTPIRMKARDGKTDIYGLMYTPTTLDSTKKYPIINHIYPGPQSGSVGTRSFVASRGDNQAVAELGFVVVEIDGMGTPGRSKAFHDAYYGRMIDNTLPDQVAGMKELAQRYRFIDIEKAGIWGHSGGGFATAAAMFTHPEFFKVGISESGNHDNRNYEDDWGERYQGLLTKNGNTDNYANEANQTHAAKLQGKLFLIHGEMDDNVPPYNTQLVVDALVKAGKDFDLLMLPHARHGYGADSPYVMRRRWDYFLRHLQGAEPPKEYPLGAPAIVP
ncbi:DPP IV N-terminal domain-containing protein [Roseisolibacter agri]|uniref:Dipeptidyl peptidase IV n=1 Tax=Roseisolibacter agri TaxID=2014610 RepID=A0AA37Q850_9BACT|nr:DPP IV N-terminal domain-containing protein [Roseisolibacter agri]GLC24766.1 dipeptidyl peptidase IV [Roseisolibacter agri]